MKRKLIGIALLFIILVLVKPVWAAPVATVEKPVYTFATVPEGTRVVHEFIVKNTGDDILTILDVQPP